VHRGVGTGTGRRRPARRTSDRAGFEEAANALSAALRSLAAGEGMERRRRSACNRAAVCEESVKRSTKQAPRMGLRCRWSDVRRPRPGGRTQLTCGGRGARRHAGSISHVRRAWAGRCVGSVGCLIQVID
jgi:hypothetical protein